jgi:hypothetical protein
MTEELEVTAEQKPKKKLPIFGVLAIVLSIVGLLVSVVTFVFIQLPTVVEFLYNCGYMIFDAVSMLGDVAYEIWLGTLSALALGSAIVGVIRDIALLLPAAVGFVISLASLGLNIKGKNHIATALGAISIAVSVISSVIIGVSIVRFITVDLSYCFKNVLYIAALFGLSI